MEIKNISIIGMGALGLLYADHITRNAPDCNVSFIMDGKRLIKYKDQTFTVNDREVKFNLVHMDKATPADLLIVAVKYPGFKQAMVDMSASIDNHTIIMSAMNGISSEEMLADIYGIENIIYTVPQGMDAMKFGNSLRFTQMGNLHIGMTENTKKEAFDSVVSFFDNINMPYIIEDDIKWRMWFKFMLNVGINQTCMVYDTTYSGAINPGTANRTLVSAMREVRVIAEAEGIKLTEADLARCIEIERTLDPNGTPSMGQDRINKNPSEVDMFAGKVIELGKKHGILTPENEFIYNKVKEIETEYI